jgi:DNA excision repair protein ERCC-3
MNYNPRNPLIIQSDMTMLLEVDSPLFEEVRDAVAPFAEIVKSPEHVHTYRITPISLWNAASSGISAEEVTKRLHQFSRYEIPHNLLVEVNDIMGRFGKVRIERHDEAMLKLITLDTLLMEQLYHTESVRNFLAGRNGPQTAAFSSVNRGLIKQALIKAGYPAIDMAGYAEGLPLGISLRENNSFKIRPYQIMARDAFYKGGTALGGNGVAVLPCGAGKTIVGMAVMDLIKSHSLILTTGITAIRQWRRELIDKTDIDPEDIGEYSGEVKEIRPVTITTYQILTHRKSREDDFLHLQTLNKHPWGLLIYDEVHLLPAQVFRFTASLQAIRRLGLTATLVREDGREGDVFALIGPKCFDVPWKVIEKQGWIAEAECFEIRTRITGDTRFRYVSAEKRQRFRIAAENPAKIPLICKLIAMHKGDRILIIGQYLEQLEKIATGIEAPIITGNTSQVEREDLYNRFRNGDLSVLVVSSVANFALDLPDASVAIQVSGKFGSRQEEAQRLGRILRPKSDGRSARFYTLVSKDTDEQDFALKRQLFLTEQGYSYTILRGDEIDSSLNAASRS